MRSSMRHGPAPAASFTTAWQGLNSRRHVSGQGCHPFGGAPGHHRDVGATAATKSSRTRGSDAPSPGSGRRCRPACRPRRHLGGAPIFACTSRMADLADMAHRGSEIAGADEDGVDARQRRDLGKQVDGLRRLKLDDDAGLLVGALEIVGRRAESRGAVDGRDAAHAERRIARSSTAASASATVCTKGSMIVCAPASSTRLTSTCSFQASRTTGSAGVRRWRAECGPGRRPRSARAPCRRRGSRSRNGRSPRPSQGRRHQPGAHRHLRPPPASQP